MNHNEIIQKLRAVAEYLKEVRVPVGEKDIIERILTAAAMLENMATAVNEPEQEAEANDAGDQ